MVENSPAQHADPAACLGPPAATAERILALLLKYRRGGAPGAGTREERMLRSVHLPCIECWVARGEALQMVLPAFPAKSPNLRKVLGALPDMAERLALASLQSLCEQIGTLHAPGARIILCSDGQVFGDLVGVTDAAVQAYRAGLLEMCAELGGHRLSLLTLADAVPDPLNAPWASPSAQCAWLLDRFGQSLDAVRGALLSSTAGRQLLCGISRFLREDDDATTASTPTQARQRAKRRAYQVIQRSQAWSALIAARHPDALRLSIHPQPADSRKFGIRLLACHDAWLTPWHGVAVQRADGFALMKRYQAEQAGARRVMIAGRPSHFILGEPAA